MKASLLLSPTTWATAAVAVLCLCATASARGPRSHAVHGGHLQRQVIRAPGAVDKHTSFTDAAGHTASRSVSRRVDPAAGMATGTRSTTYANGKTTQHTATVTRTDDGHTRQQTRVGPNGAAATKDVVVSHEGDATVRTVSRTVTPPPAP